MVKRLSVYDNLRKAAKNNPFLIAELVNTGTLFAILPFCMAINRCSDINFGVVENSDSIVGKKCILPFA